MLLAHKIELRPTAEQATYLDKACGTRRHCYNQLLAHFSQEGVKWSRKAAQQYLKEIIRPSFEWYNEVSAHTIYNAIDDLDNAFKHFFRRVKAKQKAGYPRFKKKDVNDSFALRRANRFTVSNRKLRVERLKTKIKMREELRFTGTHKQATISKRAGKYFASILVDTEDYNKKDTCREESVGVDFGVKELATLSNGVVFGANQKLKASIKKLAKLQRHMARKQKKASNRRVRAKLKIAKLHYRINNQRKAVLHEVSDYLTSKFDLITIEDLNVKGMVKNHKLARVISDAGFGMLRAFIEYKAKLRGCKVVIADRFYPSSKTCSCCGSIKKDLSLSDRIYKCGCGAELDRDMNAAINLNKYGQDTFKPDFKCTYEVSKTLAC